MVPDFMKSAYAAAQSSNCIRRAVGAVLVRDGMVIASGTNGVSSVYSDCGEADCPRCLGGGTTGLGYESCICIHGEQDAIANAAKAGISTDDADLYVTLRPCLQCLLIAKAAGVRSVLYDEDWKYDKDLEQLYRRIASGFRSFETLGRNDSRVLSD